MAFRKFWIVNGNNETYKLTNSNIQVAMLNPKGLGFARKVDVIRYEKSSTIQKSQLDMPEVSGSIFFLGNIEQAYQDYNEFVYFISRKPLKLYYQPPNSSKSYYIDCEVLQLDKTEINEQNVLECPIQFLGLSFWKSGEQTVKYFEKVISQDESVGKYYPLVREYSYSGSGYQDMQIINKNTLKTPFIFEITGRVVNPILTFYQNGEKYGIIKLLGTFDYVRINTDQRNQELYLEKDRVPLSNPISYQDLSAYDGKSYLTFFEIESGTNLLTFNADNEELFDGQLKMTWEDEFVSV